MPYEFQGDNLVYVAPKEVEGYTWKPMGQNENGTNPEGEWVKNEDFNPDSLLKGRTDKYGRVDYSLKDDATEAEKRAYALAWQGASANSPTLENNSVGNNWQVASNLGWWNQDPAIQREWEENNRRNSGNAVGMSGFKDWVVPLSILAAGAGAAIGTGALAGGAVAGETAGGAGALGATTGAGEVGASGFGLNAGVPTVGAASPSGIMATQSAAGLGGAGTGIIEGLAPTSIGMGGTTGAGSLAGIAGSEAAAGLGELGTGLTAEQLAKYEAANPGKSIKDIISETNKVRKLANALKSMTSSKANMANTSGMANALNGSMPQAEFGGLYRMNQNPFANTQQLPIQSAAKQYDFLKELTQQPTQSASNNQLLANMLYQKV